MTLVTGDPLTQLSFSVYGNKGVYALLVGSGLSRSASIPTGWEITVDLVRRVALAQNFPEQTDWASWYRKKYQREPNYSELVEQLGLSPDERRSILHSYIEPDDLDREQRLKLPTKAHKAIARLVKEGFVKVIITTNFDRLIENALREEGVEPTVVGSVDNLLGAEPLVHSSAYLLKLHGDYKDARILNTEAELSVYPAQYDALLDRIMDEYGLIICGWSGEWDHALRSAIMRSPSRRYPVYWATRGTLGNGASELIQLRRAQVIDINGADDFFEALDQRVQTLSRTHRQNPLGIELLVSTVKRYLGKPEFRIPLDDLVSQECRTLIDKLEVEALSTHGSWDSGQFRDRVSIYEAATEPMVRIAAVVGRWGTGTDGPLILDVVRALCNYADRQRDGLTSWLDLRSYPAVLVVAAYSVGLVRERRWRELHRKRCPDPTFRIIA
ncbi:SIR2 family protein [Agrobacterium tumefaciens]|nr:SIR2 family protein [Agrobacterium tumefaciens]